jgi:large subunit ribosomal protein L6
LQYKVRISKIFKKFKIEVKTHNSIEIKGSLGSQTLSLNNTYFRPLQPNNKKILTNINEIYYFTDKIKFTNEMQQRFAKIAKDVCLGYYSQILLRGIGLKAFKFNSWLAFDLGYTHFIFVKIPLHISIKIRKVRLHLLGTNRQSVEQLATEIRNLRTPDAYRGKGIRLAKQTVTLKIGKKTR